MPLLECFPMSARPPDIVPGRPQRGWMDRFSERHPYRCLPMSMANSSGWELLCPVGFTAEWTGGIGAEDVTVTKRLVKAGELLNISVLDHIILGHRTAGRDHDFASLKELGLM